MKIEGTHKIKIWRKGDWYLARCETKDKANVFLTQGKSEAEIFDMIADAFKTMFDIEDRDRCNLCNSLFEPHHHKHITRKGMFHTSCYEKQKDKKQMMEIFRKEDFK